MSTYDILNRQLNDEMQQLAELIKSGDYTENDRNRLAAIMYPKLKYFVWKFFSNPDDAEEVLQNTLYKIFKGLCSYSNSYRFTTWIYTIAKNEALLHQHNVKKQFATNIEDVTSPMNVHDTSASNFEKEMYLNLLYDLTYSEINELPNCIEKSILIDKELNHMRGNAIAEKYNMNLNTVKTKIRKARKMLKDAVLIKNPEIAEGLNEYF